MEFEPLRTLSPSRASDFKVCPQLFKYRALERREEPPSPATARGTTAHLALQRLYDLPAGQRTPEALYDLFRLAWTEVRGDEFAGLFSSVEEEREWGLGSMALLANYFTVEDPAAVEPLERELDLLEEIGGLTIRGILDRMDENEDGNLIIIDYKTGKAPPERYAIPAFFALKIYALLVRKRTGRTAAELRLLYLNGPTVYRIPITDSQLDAMDRQLGALWTAIDRAIVTDRFPTRVGPLCGYCSFQEVCPAWATDDAEERMPAEARAAAG